MYADQLLWTTRILVTQHCDFKAWLSLCMTAKLAKVVSVTSDRCSPPKGFAEHRWQQKPSYLSSFLCEPSGVHLCKHACHHVPDHSSSLAIPLLWPSTTPPSMAIYKVVLQKGSWKCYSNLCQWHISHACKNDKAFWESLAKNSGLSVMDVPLPGRCAVRDKTS